MLKAPESLIPNALLSDLLCYVVHSEGESPDVTTCHSNGYIYEIKNKEIIGNLFIGKEHVNFLSVYYAYVGSNFVRYYVIKTLSNKVFVLLKIETCFSIVKTWSDVQSVRIFDFKSVGFPQIKLLFNGLNNTELFDFLMPTFNDAEKFQTFSQSEESAASVTDADHTKNESKVYSYKINNFLMEKLQIINNYIDEVRNENSIISNSLSENLGVINSKQFNIIFMEEMKSSARINVIEFWQNLFDCNIIFGIKMYSRSDIAVKDLKLVICGKGISNYSYKFFSIVDFLPLEVSAIIEKNCEFLVIGAAEMPAIVFENCIPCKSFLVLCSGRDHLKVGTKSLLVSAHWVASKSEKPFRINDALTMATVLMETCLRVHVDSTEESLLEKALLKLGFQILCHAKRNFFFSVENGVAAFLRPTRKVSLFWKVHLFTRNLAQLYMFIEALYKVLPEKSSVLHCREKI